MYCISKKDDESWSWYWCTKTKSWIGENDIDSNKHKVYFYRKPSKIPNDGVLVEFDDHLGCVNYPNCDEYGCGED